MMLNTSSGPIEVLSLSKFASLTPYEYTDGILISDFVKMKIISSDSTLILTDGIIKDALISYFISNELRNQFKEEVPLVKVKDVTLDFLEHTMKAKKYTHLILSGKNELVFTGLNYTASFVLRPFSLLGRVYNVGPKGIKIKYTGDVKCF